MDKSFEKKYSLILNRLQNGLNHESFMLDGSFFSHFEHAPIQDCSLTIELDIFKSDDRLEVTFHISGAVVASCDRCAEDMNLPVSSEEKIIYAFSEKMKEAGDTEMMYLNPLSAELVLVQECYDFSCIAVPFRKVHEEVGETCNPEVMKYIIKDSEEEEKEIDPRWENLQKISQKNKK